MIEGVKNEGIEWGIGDFPGAISSDEDQPWPVTSFALQIRALIRRDANTLSGVFWDAALPPELSVLSS